MARGKYKYTEWLTEEGLTLIEGWSRAGLTLEQIAHNCGVHRDTLNTWKNKYPDISDALKKGAAVVDYEIESALKRRAEGYTVTEEKRYIEKGKDKDIVRRVITERHIPPDTAAAIFWLRNRMSDRWSNNPGDSGEHTVVNIVDDI